MARTSAHSWSRNKRRLGARGAFAGVGLARRSAVVGLAKFNPCYRTGGDERLTPVGIGSMLKSAMSSVQPLRPPDGHPTRSRGQVLSFAYRGNPQGRITFHHR